MSRQTVPDQAIATASRISATSLACSADTATIVALAAMLARIAASRGNLGTEVGDGLLSGISRAIEPAADRDDVRFLGRVSRRAHRRATCADVTATVLALSVNKPGAASRR